MAIRVVVAITAAEGKGDDLAASTGANLPNVSGYRPEWRARWRATRGQGFAPSSTVQSACRVAAPLLPVKRRPRVNSDPHSPQICVHRRIESKPESCPPPPRPSSSQVEVLGLPPYGEVAAGADMPNRISPAIWRPPYLGVGSRLTASETGATVQPSPSPRQSGRQRSSMGNVG